MTKNSNSPNTSKTKSAKYFKENDENSKYIAKSHENVKTDLIKITKDKLENILLKYLNSAMKRTSWITPLSLFFSFAVALITANFKETFKIPAETIQAIFIILCAGSFIWTLVEICQALKMGKKQTIEDLINKIADTDTQ